MIKSCAVPTRQPDARSVATVAPPEAPVRSGSIAATVRCVLRSATRSAATFLQPDLPPHCYATSMKTAEREQKWCAANERTRSPLGCGVGALLMPDRSVDRDGQRWVTGGACQRGPVATRFHEEPCGVAAHHRRPHGTDAPVSHRAIGPAAFELTDCQLGRDFLNLVSQPTQQGSPSSHLIDLRPPLWRHPGCLSTTTRR